jgi:hypothetical protein
MLRRNLAGGLLLMIGLVIGSVFQPLASFSVQAQGGCQSFPATGKQVCGRFLQYWQQNGGLAQQGLPLTGEFTEVSDLNGQYYTVQYFERAVFEKHPENAAPYDVLLSQLGTFQFKRKYPGGDPSGGQPPPPAANTPAPPAGEQPITFQGNTEVNTPPFALQGGTYELTWSVNLQGESQLHFSAWLNSTTGSYSELLANLIVKQGDPTSGSTMLYNVPRGQYYFEAGTTRGSWQVTLTRK